MSANSLAEQLDPLGVGCWPRRLDEADAKRVEEYFQQLSEAASFMAGYPITRDFDVEEFAKFLRFTIVNLGDPFATTTHRTHGRDFEREVVSFWADQTRAPVDDRWGYVTTGGTEGNLFALHVARNRFPDAAVYYSEDAHYSIPKSIGLLRMHGVPIRTNRSGEMRYAHLREELLRSGHKSAIVVATVGTTMTEAKDNVATIAAILSELGIDNHHIHSDAALSGAVLPFLENRFPFDFQDGCDSVSISGHKFIGSPLPSGVVLIRKSVLSDKESKIEYVDSVDPTVTGCRSGFASLLMWCAVRMFGADGFRARARYSMDLARRVLEGLVEQGVPAWSNPEALTVIVPSVGREVKTKWQLASAHGWSHIIVMPHMTVEMMDALVSDVVEDYHFGLNDEVTEPSIDMPREELSAEQSGRFPRSEFSRVSNEVEDPLKESEPSKKSRVSRD